MFAVSSVERLISQLMKVLLIAPSEVAGSGEAHSSGAATRGGVAGLPGDPVEIEAQQGGVQSEPGGDGGFTQAWPPPTTITSKDPSSSTDGMVRRKVRVG